jgi:hypothetical protein
MLAALLFTIKTIYWFWQHHRGSGFLFLFILALKLVIGALGYLMEKDAYEPAKDLKKINKNPKNFKIGIGLH